MYLHVIVLKKLFYNFFDKIQHSTYVKKIQIFQKNSYKNLFFIFLYDT